MRSLKPLIFRQTVNRTGWQFANEGLGAQKLAPHAGYISNSGGRRSLAFEPVRCLETLKLMCGGCLLSSLGAQGRLVSNRVPCPRPRSDQELDPAYEAGGCWGRADATGVLTANIWAADHVLADAGLANLDAELKEFAVDARHAPERVLPAHLADQCPGFLGDRRSPGLSAPDLPSPEQPEALAMLGSDGLRLHDHQGKTPVAPNRARPSAEEPARGSELPPLLR